MTDSIKRLFQQWTTRAGPRHRRHVSRNSTSSLISTTTSTPADSPYIAALQGPSLAARGTTSPPLNISLLDLTQPYNEKEIDFWERRDTLPESEHDDEKGVYEEDVSSSTHTRIAFLSPPSTSHGPESQDDSHESDEKSQGQGRTRFWSYRLETAQCNAKSTDPTIPRRKIRKTSLVDMLCCLSYGIGDNEEEEYEAVSTETFLPSPVKVTFFGEEKTKPPKIACVYSSLERPGIPSS